MHLLITFVYLVSVLGGMSFPVPETGIASLNLESKAISTSVYGDLIHYFKYASSAYSATCPAPNGNDFISMISNAGTDTHGFIARDDNKKEIIVAIRGSSSLENFIMDADMPLVSFTSPGVNAPTGTLVHSGFLTCWNSVASEVFLAVRAQLNSYPGYSVVTSGHSLGGALASLAGISLKQNIPNMKLRIFTYGQPRTGNLSYAQFVNSIVGAANIFRGVHTTDGVPTMIPTYLGYAHHGTEYWSFLDPPSSDTTKRCNSNGEDMSCSASNIISGGIDAAHLTYYNIFYTTAYCS